ncbi:MAG: BspA family leucine-rich repeat surface protein [Nonlabens sp.]|uniref:BspA family leucine-rich repeat surface protein n=1 Tax=Nonlabens sp. TaxID=1888209 RepID=UPI003EF8A6C0
MRVFTIVFLFFGLFASAQTPDDFVFDVDVTSSYSFRLTSYTNVAIDWGDGVTNSYVSPNNLQVTHTYSIPGVYTVIVTGPLNAIYLFLNDDVVITQWGNSQFLTMEGAFSSCQNLSINATDVPDLSNVTSMSRMFIGATNFNSNISNWDVSNVRDMSHMFNNTHTFNQSLATWDVSNVTNMERMFYETGAFNQPLNNWNVSNVTNLKAMFSRSIAFNQPLDNWDVSNVTDMSFMFNYSVAFNGSLNNWDVSNINNMTSIFSYTTAFNQPLNNWDVSNVNFMARMFFHATAFNQPLNGWNVSNVMTMDEMFGNALNFNSDISNWDVSNVSDMDRMFQQAGQFNQPLNSWDVSNVQTMNFMFDRASAFNQPLDNWDISSLSTAHSLFNNALSFNQNISTWNFPSVVIYDHFLDNTALDSTNYDQFLARLVELNLTNNTLGAQYLEYCDSFSRSILIQNGWSIFFDSQSTDCPDNNLNGSVFYDLDVNGCSASDVPSQNVAINIADGTIDITVFTFNGQYSVNLPDGTYTVTPATSTNLFSGTPASINVTVSNAATVTQDFCLTATSPIDDLEVTILPLQEARPGFDTDYKLIYKNKGTTVLSGSVDFTYEDDYMDFLTATPAVTTSSVGALNWSFSNLNPFETREIEFSMSLNTPTDPNFPLNSNDILNFNATVNPTASDDTPLDNVFDLQQTVVNSYDPNDKTCLQGETILPSDVGEYVHYRIRFENEGTASAITVKIIDYIDTTKYDISTLIPLSASHDYITTITEGNKVEFLFDNINLPFTAPASQGYVLFKIKTVDTLVLGDDFSNQAEIFFDFNASIITNLETTTVATTAGLNDRNLFAVQLYPNPAQDEVTLSSNTAFNSFTIYNTTGNVILREQFEEGTISQKISLENVASGLYFIEVSNGENRSVRKLLKQ